MKYHLFLPFLCLIFVLVSCARQSDPAKATVENSQKQLGYELIETLGNPSPQDAVSGAGANPEGSNFHVDFNGVRWQGEPGFSYLSYQCRDKHDKLTGILIFRKN